MLIFYILNTCSTIGHSPFGLEVHVSSDWQAVPQTLTAMFLWYTVLCVYSKHKLKTTGCLLHVLYSTTLQVTLLLPRMPFCVESSWIVMLVLQLGSLLELPGLGSVILTIPRMALVLIKWANYDCCVVCVCVCVCVCVYVCVIRIQSIILFVHRPTCIWVFVHGDLHYIMLLVLWAWLVWVLWVTGVIRYWSPGFPKLYWKSRAMNQSSSVHLLYTLIELYRFRCVPVAPVGCAYSLCIYTIICILLYCVLL